MITYERHPREYTIVGVLAAYEGFFTPQFIDFYGGTLHEIIAVVRDGQHYHFQREGDKQRLAESFLRRVDSRSVDLESSYADFDHMVTAYEELLAVSQQDYTKELILNLYSFYRNLMLYAQAGFDTLDYVGVLSPDMRPIYTDWVVKVRRRAERIYKDGEHDFIPAYIWWLRKTHLSEYSVDQLLHVTPQEMTQYIENDAKLPEADELTKRAALLFARHYPVERQEILTGDAANKRIAELGLFDDEYDNLDPVTELQGQVAYPGSAVGRARVINKRAEMDKFQDGEVLVSIMTDPSFLPIMKKASAFITEEGGILSHAAIVARELKRPCIIGTKIATKVIKDGDMLEVDAEKGIVKIL